MGIDPGCCQYIYLLPSYHIHEAAYHGGSQEHEGPSLKVGQIQDYEGYLMLIIALDSIYLNPYNDIANRLSEGVSQMTHLSMRSEIGPTSRVIFNEPWHNGVDLGTIVKESHPSLPIDSYSGYILNPVPSVKGVRIQEGSLHLAFYALGVPSWSTFSMITFP